MTRGGAEASADDGLSRVAIDSRSPRALTDAGRPAVVEGRLLRRPGAPAVVVIGSGLDRARVLRHARVLAEHGLGALLLRTRGRLATQLADVFAAAGWLIERADAASVAILGIGDGGRAATLAAYEQLAAAPRFAAHVALDVPPDPRLEDYRTTGAPIAILAAGRSRDRARLDLVAGDLREGGSPVELVMFETAGRGWDADGARTRLSLSVPRTRVTPDGELYDERSGRIVRSGVDRIALGAVRPGMVALRPDTVFRAASDAVLVRTLAR